MLDSLLCPDDCTGRYLLPTQHWSLRFDPHNEGDQQRWFAADCNRSSGSGWTALRGPHTRPWQAIPEMDAWRTNHTPGKQYNGYGWYAAEIDDKPLWQGVGGGGNSFWVSTSGMEVVSAELWIDGVKTTAGCATPKCAIMHRCLPPPRPWFCFLWLLDWYNCRAAHCCLAVWFSHRMQAL